MKLSHNTHHQSHYLQWKTIWERGRKEKLLQHPLLIPQERRGKEPVRIEHPWWTKKEN